MMMQKDLHHNRKTIGAFVAACPMSVSVTSLFLFLSYPFNIFRNLLLVTIRSLSLSNSLSTFCFTLMSGSALSARAFHADFVTFTPSKVPCLRACMCVAVCIGVSA